MMVSKMEGLESPKEEEKKVKSARERKRNSRPCVECSCFLFIVLVCSCLLLFVPLVGYRMCSCLYANLKSPIGTFKSICGCLFMFCAQVCGVCLCACGHGRVCIEGSRS